MSDSQLEAKALSDFQNLRTPNLDHDFDSRSRPRAEHTPFESRNARQSLGSYHSNSTSTSQELTIRKSSCIDTCLAMTGGSFSVLLDVGV